MTTLRPDVESASAALKTRRLPKDALNAVGDNVEDDERVLRLATGVRRGVRGVLVLTDRRLMFIRVGWLRKSQETIPLDLVTGVGLSHGFKTSTIRTQGAQSLEEVESIHKADAEAFASELKQLLAKRAQAALSGGGAAPLGASTVVDQLSKLAALRQQGLLTDEEFEAQKARLLNDS